MCNTCEALETYTSNSTVALGITLPSHPMSELTLTVCSCSLRSGPNWPRMPNRLGWMSKRAVRVKSGMHASESTRIQESSRAGLRKPFLARERARRCTSAESGEKALSSSVFASTQTACSSAGHSTVRTSRPSSATTSPMWTNSALSVAEARSISSSGSARCPSARTKTVSLGGRRARLEAITPSVTWHASPCAVICLTQCRPPSALASAS
mmetsp:Transcript_37478/g.87627  ORF Transcript_37478/g.87627 Transcript_37478/m.87627 type:complete len:211 (+) Transcript_37478:1040-1672(+)